MTPIAPDSPNGTTAPPVKHRRPPRFAVRLLRWATEVHPVLKVGVPLMLWVLASILYTQVPTTDGVLPAGEAIYAGLRLFVLNSSHFPAGSSVADGALWALHGLAPAITATAVLDFVRRHILSSEVLARTLVDHAVICGAGEHGRVIGRALRERGFDVVYMDNQLARSPQSDALLIQGDMTLEADLKAAGVDRARHVFFAAGCPIRNARATVLTRPLKQSDCDLHALVDAGGELKNILRQLGLRDHEVVDQFKAASAAIVGEPCVRPHLQEQGTIAIVGLGRFGHAVLRQLQSAGVPGPVRIVDPYGGRRAATHSTAELQLEGHDGENAVGWARTLSSDGRPPTLVFLCIDDDAVVLHTAELIREAGCDAVIVLRCGSGLPPDPTGLGRTVARSVPDLFEAALVERLGDRSAVPR